MAAATRLLAGLAAGLLMTAPASAQMFSLYLKCKGQIDAAGKSKPAQIDFALRDNNQTALIQSSNILPVGERMKYVPSQTHYAMVYKTPHRGSQVYVGWFQTVIVSYPNFERWTSTRISIDRQTGVLNGEIMAVNDELLGRMTMNCEPTKEEDAPAPKF